MNISTITTTKTKIELNKKDIIEGINKYLKIGKVPDNAKVFVTIPDGDEHRNMKLEIDHMVPLEVLYDNYSIVHTLNENDIFTLLYGDQKIPHSLKIYVCIPGCCYWSEQKLYINKEISVCIEFKEKDTFKADKEYGTISEHENKNNH